jgi:hypothetical protein
MRYFRRLPPLLRVASLLGLLFSLAALALLVPLLFSGLWSFPWFPQVPSDFGRRGIIAIIAFNLGMLGGACTNVVNIYTMRFREPDLGPFLLSSWQSQVRAIVAGEALPLCALALALVALLIPLPLDFVFVVVAAISVLAAVVWLMAAIWVPVHATTLD